MAGNIIIGNYGLPTSQFTKFSGFSNTVTTSVARTRAMACDWNNSDSNLYFGSDTGSNKYYKGTGFGVTVQSSFATPIDNTPYDMDHDSSGNFFLAMNETKIFKMSGFSSTVSDSLTEAAASRGVTWDGTNLITNINTPKTKLHSGFSTTISSSFTLANFLEAIAWDGTDLYGGISGSVRYLHLSGFSSTVSDSFTTIVNVTDPIGVDWDAFPAVSTAVTAVVTPRLSPSGGVVQGGGGII